MPRALALLGVLVLAAGLASCTGGGSDDGSSESAADQATVALVEVLPDDVRTVVALDLEGLDAADGTGDLEALLDEPAGEGALLGLDVHLVALVEATSAVDVAATATRAVVATTTDPAQGSLIVADVGTDELDEVVDGPAPEVTGTHGSEERQLYVDDAGTHLALLPDGVLVVGSEAGVAATIDAADGGDADDGALGPFLELLDGSTDIGFAYGLPAAYDEAIEPDRSLRSAIAATGALDVVDGTVSGTVAFHTEDAAGFVEGYNGLDRNAQQAEDPTAEPLEAADGVVDGLDQVVVPLPETPLVPSDEEAIEIRNLFKKLVVGMEAHEQAERVDAQEADPWVDLLVKSEADEDEPPSPGSVFIRWRFKDQAAVEAFEANELPEGFSLAPTQFLESDDTDGELFLALNLYNSGGGSIVTGMRAEWDVFVAPPEGADPDAPDRPRFLIIDALAEAVSADPVNLVTPAEPLSHRFEGERVTSSVARLEDGETVDVFESSFTVPDPASAPVARFTREMAIGNDYIYWANGVYDRVLYDASTFNHDAYFVDLDGLEIRDDSRWAQYLEPEAMDAVYYVNTLSYVASPLANLDSDHLDVTDEWREEVLGFKTNGHQTGLVRAAVDQLFQGQGDALVGERIANDVPTTDIHVEIADPDGFEAALDLPDGHRLAPIAVVEGGEANHLLTLSVTEVDGAPEGTRATWTTYVDDGSGRPPHRLVLDVATPEVRFDPVELLAAPDAVRHSAGDGEVEVGIGADGVAVDLAFATSEATDEELTLDWLESGDEVCTTVGICDRRYYDAETLDVPVHRPADIDVAAFETPWDEFLADEPALVLFRDNAQEQAVKRWHDLEVPVPELPFSGLDDRTHEITGSGTLAGRTTDVVDSTYTYTGDAIVDGDQLTFAIDQQIDNALGEAHIYTTGEFDLTTGSGTQTVVDCKGPDLMCSDIVRGSTALYEVDDLDASEADAITWAVDIAVELGGTFGTADSASTFTATRD